MIAHFAVSITLWLVASLSVGDTVIKWMVLFFLWNIPAFALVIGLGLSATMEALDAHYRALLLAALTPALLITVVVCARHAYSFWVHKNGRE